MRKPFLLVSLLLALLTPLLAQQPVSLQNLHERLICVVPVIGTGTLQDPYRPMFVPPPGRPGDQRSQSGIIAYTSQLSDDGKFALVEFVARDAAAFEPILSASRSEIKVFHKGKTDKKNIQAELRKYKKDFDIDKFGVAVP